MLKKQIFLNSLIIFFIFFLDRLSKIYILNIVENEGIVTVMSSNKEDLDKAIGMIKGIVAVPEVGDVYDSVVKSIMPYGAFVEFLPGKQGLVHISELAWERVEKVEDVLKQDQNIKVKLIGVDQRSGKFKLSHKVLLPKPVKEES